MAFTLDARIPVIFAAPGTAGPGDAVLLEGDASVGEMGRTAHFQPGAGDAAGHAPGCSCCAARLPAGRALAGLLQDRARGRVAFFTRVIAATHSRAGRAEVEAALAGDPVASACFRAGP